MLSRGSSIARNTLEGFGTVEPAASVRSGVPRDRDAIFATDYLRADLAGRSVRGGAVTLGSQAARFLIQSISTVVLARLLMPEDFGLVAMVMVVVGFAAVFQDMGFSWATVQSPRITHDQVSALFWIQIAVTSGLAAVVALSSPLVAAFYDEPRLTAIGYALSSLFILHGVAAQHLAILRRQMRFGAMAVVQVFSLLASVVLAILVALRGGGYWAVVTHQVASPAVAAILLWSVTGWRPGVPRRRANIGSLVSFGSYLTASSFLNYFTKQADKALIGFFAGPAQLGLYSKAYSLFKLPIAQLNGPLNSVAMPALSRLHDRPDEYRRFYLRLVQGLAYVSMPLVATVAAVSDLLIPLVLGEQWTGAARVFQMLALAGLVTPVLWTAGWVNQSMGRADRQLRWSLLSDPLYVLSFVIGVRWGAVGVAAAFAVTILLLWLPTMAYAFRITTIELSDFMRIISPPAVLTVVAFGAAYAVVRMAPFDDWITLASALLASISIVGFVGFAWPNTRRDIKVLATMRTHLKRAASPSQ